MHVQSTRFRTLYRTFAVLLLLALSLGAVRSSAAPLRDTDTGIGPVMALALDSAGDGWAWANAAPQKPGTRYLLRIEDGSWNVFSDSVKDPKLLPLGMTVIQMALTADGKSGWAIGSADATTPLFWRFDAGKWSPYTSANIPNASIKPLSISITADGTDGWMTLMQTVTSEPQLYRLRSGAWTVAAQPDGGRLEMVSISPDGKNGIALGAPRTNSPLAIYKLKDGAWSIPIDALDRDVKATAISSDNQGRGWVLADNTRLFQVTTDNKLKEVYKAEKDVKLNSVATDGDGRGYAIGWLDIGQQAAPGGIVFTRKPALVRVENDTALAVTALAAGFAPDDVGAESLAISNGGAQLWSGVISGEGFGQLVHFHEPWIHSVEGPSTATPLSGEGLCFADVPYCLRGAFYKFWQEHGGIDSMGLPITTEVFEKLGDKTYRVQYTERARLEEHPEFIGTSSEVLLGLLGNELADARSDEAPFKPVAESKPPSANAHFYPETGHMLDAPFLAYWTDKGGVPVYGFPRSEAFNEKNQADGKTYLVQYFERNRIEYHPENKGTKYEFLLGLLGVEHFTAQYGYKP